MSKRMELDALCSDIAALEVLLDSARDAQDSVGVLQLERRIAEMRASFDSASEKEKNKAYVKMFFGGKPVIGSRGIVADFAGKALDKFQEIVSKTAAQAELGSLGERGRVPLASDTSLMITNVARGSFGFILAEASGQEQLVSSSLQESIDRILVQIDNFADDSDASFEETVEDVDGRTLSAMRDFFDNLDANEATLRLVDNSTEVSLNRVQVNLVKRRLETTEVDDTHETITGVLIGLLPEHRNFEMRLGTGETIFGRVSKEAVEQYDSQTRSHSSVINSLCTVQVLVREVRPINRPSRLAYRLLSFEQFSDTQNDA